jgi:hypothetical protein
VSAVAKASERKEREIAPHVVGKTKVAANDMLEQPNRRLLDQDSDHVAQHGAHLPVLSVSVRARVEENRGGKVHLPRKIFRRLHKCS